VGGVIQTRTARIEGTEDGIVVARIGADEQTLEDAKENLSACARLASPGRRPLLVDMSRARPLAPEVRHHYTGETLHSSFRALGLLVKATPLGQMMGNVYLRIARPGLPTHIFADEGKALAWLRART
jgi:hypothetical protein